MANSRYTLKPSEVQRLIFHCTDLRERIIIRLMVHCGLRREETAGLLIERIDWNRNRMSFIGKGHLNGIVPLPPDLMQDIKFYIAGRKSGYLFPAKKRQNAPLVNLQINRIVATVGQRAGIKSPNPDSKTGDINPHLLRHTFCRMCKDAGLSIEEVQGLARHKSFKTTYDTYGTLDFEEIQRRYEAKFLNRI